LLLPAGWKWNVDEHLAKVDMETWSWFVHRIHLICPNLHRLACSLNEYGYAIMEHQILPALLEMEVQRTTDLNMLAADEVACRLSIDAEEAKRIARFYEHLARRPPNWQRTVELAQQHM
jgi:NADH:ubiquinone oxidoreductase subunit E